MATVTIELDQVTATFLETQATMQGLSVSAWLRKLSEKSNSEGHGSSSDNESASEPEQAETLGERLARKGLIGMIDSSQPRLDSLPISDRDAQSFQSDFGQHLLEEYQQQVEDMNSTIGERLEKRGLLGAIDSSQPDPDSPPHRDAFFYLIADELEKQGFKL